MGKTRDVFKKIRDSKGTFYAKMCTIKDGNGMDLTEAEDIKTRWQEYTDRRRGSPAGTKCWRPGLTGESSRAGQAGTGPAGGMGEDFLTW